MCFRATVEITPEILDVYWGIRASGLTMHETYATLRREVPHPSGGTLSVLDLRKIEYAAHKELHDTI